MKTSIPRIFTLHKQASIILLAGLLLITSTNSLNHLFSNLKNIDLISNKQAGNSKISGHSNSSAYLLAVHFFSQQNYPQAIKILLATDLSKDPLARWYLAKAYEAEGQWETSLQILTPKTIEEKELFFSLLSGHLLEIPDTQDPNWQERVRKDFPDYTLVFADQLLKSQKFTRAESWAKSLPDYTQSDYALRIIGSANFYLGNLQLAEQDFKQAYSIQASATNEYWYGRTLLLNNKAIQAIPFLERASQQDTSPISSWYLRDLATAYAKIGECDKANDSTMIALQRDLSSANFNSVTELRTSLKTYCPQP